VVRCLDRKEKGEPLVCQRLTFCVGGGLAPELFSCMLATARRSQNGSMSSSSPPGGGSPVGGEDEEGIHHLQAHALLGRFYMHYRRCPVFGGHYALLERSGMREPSQPCSSQREDGIS